MTTAMGIIDIAIDRDGSKWFRAGSGILRFDGSRWTIYRPNLPVSVGNSILIDPEGVKWLLAWAPQQFGFVRFDGERWIFYPSPYPTLA